VVLERLGLGNNIIEEHLEDIIEPDTRMEY
jgi:hypothetical protein